MQPPSSQVHAQGSPTLSPFTDAASSHPGMQDVIMDPKLAQSDPYMAHAPGESLREIRIRELQERKQVLQRTMSEAAFRLTKMQGCPSECPAGV